MTRAAVACSLAFALGAAASGCGGSEKPLARTARPCLAKLGLYVHHAKVAAPPATTATLPVLDPDKPLEQEQFVRSFNFLPWPDDLEEYGEVSFRNGVSGANSVQVLIFDGADLPKKIETSVRTKEVREVHIPRGEVVRHDRTILIWSSSPTPKQRAAVSRCLEA